MTEKDYIKTIFGLKLKQTRNRKNLSLFDLSTLSGMSKSYLNEIEKGKKFPREDKIESLSKVLKVSFKELTSLDLDKDLAPLAKILKSNILREIPLAIFGIEERDLIDIIAEAPVKVNSFISTLIEIANNYNLTKQNFYLAALRSYQEANENYFNHIEIQAKEFSKLFLRTTKSENLSDSLRDILINEYGYRIKVLNFEKDDEDLQDLRSIYIDENRTLLINDIVEKSQEEFIFAKEIAYNYLNLVERLDTFSWAKFDNFKQLLNNFYMSYFAGAVLIPKKELSKSISSFIQTPTWDTAYFQSIINQFTSSPETFYQRLTNILPIHFDIKDLFFLRFNHKVGTNKYHITKELHIAQRHSPHANETSEFYCRRWLSINTIKILEDDPERMHVNDCQISTYPEQGNSKYLVISSATKDPFKLDNIRSVTIGILITDAITEQLALINDKEIPLNFVGVTCQSCGIKDCKERMVPTTTLEKINKGFRLQKSVDKYVTKFK